MKKHGVFTLISILTLFSILSRIEGKDAAKLRIVRTIVITPEGRGYLNPKLSPDGSLVAFRGRNGGLFIRNADESGSIITIIPRGKGVDDYVWSPDSRKIAYDVRSFKDRKRSSELHIFEIDKKESKKIKEKDWPFTLTRWNYTGIKVTRKRTIKTQKPPLLETLNLSFDQMTNDFVQSNEPFVYFYFDMENIQHVVVVKDGNGNVLSKIPGYILPVMSPKNDKFLASHPDDGHTYVLSLSGEVISDLGHTVNEAWSENGRLIIYQIAEYGGWEGQVLVGSEIYVINGDGTGKNQLTHTPDINEMLPQWSNDMSKISYYDYNTGRIYVSELEEIQ